MSYAHLGGNCDENIWFFWEITAHMCKVENRTNYRLYAFISYPTIIQQAKMINILT